eukprot:8265968-Alexandrium_andersonii.AAC.1
MAVRLDAVLSCTLERIGPSALGLLIKPAPEWTRVSDQSWGPISAWKYVTSELGYTQVQDGGLRWNRQDGALARPRPQQAMIEDF